MIINTDDSAKINFNNKKLLNRRKPLLFNGYYYHNYSIDNDHLTIYFINYKQRRILTHWTYSCFKLLKHEWIEDIILYQSDGIIRIKDYLPYILCDNYLVIKIDYCTIQNKLSFYEYEELYKIIK